MRENGIDSGVNTSVSEDTFVFDAFSVEDEKQNIGNMQWGIKSEESSGFSEIVNEENTTKDNKKNDSVEVTDDLGDLLLPDEEEQFSFQKTYKSTDSTEVDDDMDISGTASEDELYRMREHSAAIESEMISRVDNHMEKINSTMQDTIKAQADAIAKSSEVNEKMTENISIMVQSQSKIVDTMTKAIDQHLDNTAKQLTANLDSRIDKVIDVKVDDTVYETVEKPLTEHNKRRQRRKRIEFIWMMIKIGVVLLICLFLYANKATRMRIGLVVNDFKNVITGIVKGDENVNTNKLVKDLGVDLHRANQIYYDENGNEISEEEYYKKLGTIEENENVVTTYSKDDNVKSSDKMQKGDE